MPTMTAIERVETVLRDHVPDRVPVISTISRSSRGVPGRSSAVRPLPFADKELSGRPASVPPCGGMPGMDYLLDEYSRLMDDRGVTAEVRAEMFVANPAAAMSLAGRHGPTSGQLQ